MKKKGMLWIAVCIALVCALTLPCMAADTGTEERMHSTLVHAGIFSAAVKDDGTVFLSEDPENTREWYEALREEAADWEGVVSIAPFSDGLAALNEDGTLLSAGFIPDGNDWEGIEAIYSNKKDILLVIREDGSVGGLMDMPDSTDDYEWVREVKKWENVKEIYFVDDSHKTIIGLDYDGNIHCTAKDEDWAELIANICSLGFVKNADNIDFTKILTAGDLILFGDLSDPDKYHIVGDDKNGNKDRLVASLEEIHSSGRTVLDICVNFNTLVFLLDDGTIYHTDPFLDGMSEKELEEMGVTFALELNNWTDIKAIDMSEQSATGYMAVLGLKSDGTVVAVGDNWYGDCNVEDWSDVCVPGAAEKAEESEKAAANTKTVTLGSYEGEALEWIVLAEEDGKQLLLSKECIDCRPMLDGYREISWKSSDLRAWLNEEFYEEAFTADEQDKILLSSLVNKPNPNYSKTTFKNTSDHVFLLSINEAKEHFEKDKERIADISDYALEVAKENDAEDCSWWWLRTCGKDGFYFAGINTNGGIQYGGYNEAQYGYVRPAIWVEKE